ncbi:MAG: S41 family peptidase [Pseudomonadales bacterium]|jgi:carboxyl-terminal processing protease|nr:S41 family peptidase [Pseudomonadales bacterium]
MPLATARLPLVLIAALLAVAPTFAADAPPRVELPAGTERIESEPRGDGAPLPLAPPAEALPLEDLRAFVEVIDRIRSAYVEDVDDRTLFESAIRGMLDALDPHSAYLAGREYSDLQEATSGSFGGVGLEVSIEGSEVRVIAPLDDTPAQRAGVLAGDVILEIDGETVGGPTLLPTIEAMRGEPGTTVTLRVRRNEAEDPLEFELVRDVIEVASVNAEVLEPGFAYIRISQFQSRTGRDLERALGQLQDQNGGKLDGIVLDLRNNPGGVLQASVQVADSFLSGGRIVYTEGRLAGAEASYDATADDLSNGAPMVVLVNEGSASAAEIVAGALQDHHRAVIMGTPSFGKGSVQTVLPLSDDRAIKLTTALYFTPNGRSIQAQGIVPDITVERGRVRAAERQARTREADLPGHLDSPDATQGSDSGDPSALQSEDYQVAEALNLLKGLHLLSMRSEG